MKDSFKASLDQGPSKTMKKLWFYNIGQKNIKSISFKVSVLNTIKKSRGFIDRAMEIVKKAVVL